MPQFLYCYKLVVPFYLIDNFYVIMQQSLNAEFPQYTVKMERRGGAVVMVIRDMILRVQYSTEGFSLKRLIKN